MTTPREDAIAALVAAGMWEANMEWAIQERNATYQPWDGTSFLTEAHDVMAQYADLAAVNSTADLQSAETVKRLARAMHDEWDCQIGPPSESGIACAECIESAERVIAALADEVTP